MALRIQDIYTFYLVARSGAMHLAADELGVTPGAVSQRIRAVETRHGKRLFTRSRSGIAMTKAGEALWSEIEAPLARIEAAHRKHFAHASDTMLRISAAPTFAQSLLVPHLGEFSRAHPKSRITIEADDRLVDLRSEPIDLAIRHGLGAYPGLKAEWLCSPEMIVVGSPALLAQGKPIHEPSDCLAYPLIQDALGADWPLWFEALGVDAGAARYGPAFKDDFLTVKAAVAGQGLALLSDVYVKDELARNALVMALDVAWPTEFACYAVAVPATFEWPIVRSFVQWLRQR